MNFNSKKQQETADGAVIEFAETTLAEILGQKAALEAKPLFLKNHTLTVTCSSSDVAQNLMLRQQEIADKINQKLGKKEVDRIRYLL